VEGLSGQAHPLVVPGRMRSFRFPAMGTEVHLLVPAAARGAIVAVRDLFFTWEATLSRFLLQSELSLLNDRGGERVVVSPLLFDVVRTSIDAARATDGVFDPTLERQLVRIGYDRPFAAMPRRTVPTTAAAERGGAWKQVALDPDSRTIALPPGCALDLGGIAKGMAVDAALDLLQLHEVVPALVGAGGDLAVRGLPPGGRAWPVSVGEVDEVVRLVCGALATSGIARRAWRQGELERHHLLDPATGEPVANDLCEVTVAASSCREAEVAATATFVLGADGGAGFLLRHRLAGRITRDDGTVLYVGAWPSPVPEAA
jgi:thiamine biosynthesis lipoprotein